MRLSEHPDFDQAVLRAAEHFRDSGLRPALIEKDYFVTEALREIAEAGQHAVIFKGGTSLSKGWNLIQRFSEDIDLFLDPQAFTPALGKKGIDRELKRLRDAVAKVPGLTFLKEKSQTIGGFGRNDRFGYEQQFGGPGEVQGEVFLESGTASGREPTADIQIDSYVGRFLRETDASLGATDEPPFTMRLLHFRRTFVEKLFTIHGKVQAFLTKGERIGAYARHYYDLYQLSQHEEVLRMLQSAEYAEIKADYDEISRRFFDRGYHPPKGMTFRDSESMFPSESLNSELGPEFESQCQVLCYGPYPSWQELRDRFEEIRDLL
ncbi:MAG: nucleotidyl transferase AbiEii/AbiGii toxin family protein [Planctomycetaceae bacterium]|nr:nucleotidyl transferase AbiEii/AbiGii toxin family protein [Planctomycetales bacterium]MCB9924321.1 nucleotidyl transferase AbiEii/AbiGii toxin family protein [Planctomycetaceae bacterium]